MDLGQTIQTELPVETISPGWMGNYASWMRIIARGDEYTIDKRILLEAVCIAGSFGMLAVADHRLGVRQAVVGIPPEDFEKTGGLVTLMLTDSMVDRIGESISTETERLLEENRILRYQNASLKKLLKIPLSDP